MVNKSVYSVGIFGLLKSNQALFNRGRKHSKAKKLLLKYSPVKVLVIYNSEIHIRILVIYKSNIHILVSVIYNSKTRLHVCISYMFILVKCQQILAKIGQNEEI